MSQDHPVVESHKATVGFTAKVNMEERGGAKYDTREFSVFLPTEIDPSILSGDVDEDRTAVAAILREAFLLAKGSVFEQAGLPFKYDKEGHILIEQIEAAFPGTKAENGTTQAGNRAPSAPSGPRTPGTQKVGQKSSGGGSKAPSGGEKPKLEGEAAWRDLVDNYGGWFDNREDKKNDKAPDFKRKGTGEGLWLLGRNGEYGCPDFVLDAFGLRDEEPF